MAGTSVDLLFFPIDTIKTRLQSAQGFVQAGGFKGVYRGVGSVVVGSAPGGKSNLSLLSKTNFNTNSSCRVLFDIRGYEEVFTASLTPRTRKPHALSVRGRSRTTFCSKNTAPWIFTDLTLISGSVSGTRAD
jgi:hypothetical protein